MQHILSTFAPRNQTHRKMKRIKIMSIIAMMLLTGSRMAAQTHTPVTTLQRPKLVVGIVVDQMRWDYLYRYQKRYTEGVPVG